MKLSKDELKIVEQFDETDKETITSMLLSIRKMSNKEKIQLIKILKRDTKINDVIGDED